MAFDAAKAASSTCVLLSGEDNVLRLRAVQDVLTAAGLTADDMLEVTRIVADSSPPVEWFGQAESAPFLSPRRVVVVRNLGRADVPKPASSIESMVRSIPEYSLVVLVADDETGDFRKQQTVASRVSAWTKAVLAGGGYAASFADLKPGSIKEIQAEARSLGKSMTPQAAKTLDEVVGGRFTLARAELEKVAIYVGEREEITPQDVLKAATPDPSFNVWHMVAAIIEGNHPSALSKLRTLLSTTKDIPGEMLTTILPNTNRQFRLVWQAKGMLSSGNNAANPGESEGHLPKTRPVTKESEWGQNRAFRGAHKTDFAKLRSCFALIAEADARIKGQESSASARETAEELVLRLTEVCRS